MPKRILTGKVVSDKMPKTCIVEVGRVFAHPVYRKRITRVKRYKAHNELGAKAGDRVRIIESKPISKDKRWVVEEVLKQKRADKADKNR